MERHRKTLLNKISKADFALNDLALYLDTHPTDINARRLYEYYQKTHEEMTNEYGTLTRKITGNSGNNHEWNWCDGPWPWEREYNEEI